MPISQLQTLSPSVKETTTGVGDIQLYQAVVDAKGDLWAIGGPDGWSGSDTVESVLVHLACAATAGDDGDTGDAE